ncbi:hypothetical protein P153DRAFT_341095 [Dothidotthia symphoricarpi CBS 119687]|uniref:FAR-17a/AIG1-like protein n=1 Tax=Dothidotthia symphoricarpi CBS 119687 TaxID=1392245 RepID=A0A6A6ACG5_9PLEO|nr:uncharacterized protein P153DRAFT_341095 [Dothidotthia symphoricarpi CBS 119687]KAF2128825.1 hypothetical protein P153DRAFT_341095 [Dothidotthia symphoricarpi CBS 119687]
MELFSFEKWGVSASGFDSSRSFVRSHFISPLLLAIIRAVLSIYCFTTIIIGYSWLASNIATQKLKDVNIGSYTIHQNETSIAQTFSFFTFLTFWSLGFYFMISSIHTFMYTFRQRTWLHSWPRVLQLLHSMFFSTMTTYPFLVTIVFWGTMNSGWPAGRFEQWLNISVHGLNSVFAITEIVLSATQPLPWNHLSVILLGLSAYLGLAYLTRDTQGFYVYEWMNPAHGNVSIILHILGYAAGVLTIFVLVRYTIVARNVIALKMRDGRKDSLEKDLGQESDSDAWSAEVVVVRPKEVHKHADSPV